MIRRLVANIRKIVDGSLMPKAIEAKDFKLLISYINVYILKR